MLRQCTKCGSFGPFYANKKVKDGLHTYCCECEKKRAREYHHQHKNDPEYIARTRAYRELRRQAPEEIKKDRRIRKNQLQRQHRNNNLDHYRQKEAAYQIGREAKYGKEHCKTIVRRAAANYKMRHPDRVYRTNKDQHLKRCYGITIEQFDEMVKAQGNKCAACKTSFDGMAPKTIHVDHDHQTGRVRGVLCTNCNLAVGLLYEDPVRAQGLLAYLRRQAKKAARESERKSKGE